MLSTMALAVGLKVLIYCVEKCFRGCRERGAGLDCVASSAPKMWECRQSVFLLGNRACSQECVVEVSSAKPLECLEQSL